MIDKYVLKWTQIMLKVSKESYGEKEISIKSRSWWSSKLSRLKTKTRKLAAVYRKTKNEADRIKWKKKHAEYKRTIKTRKLD